MKKLLTSVILLVLAPVLLAQGEMTSLDAVAAKWSDGTYPSRNVNSGMWEPMTSGKSEIKFNKGSNGKIVSIEIESTTYKANVSESSPFVNYYYTSGGDRLYITDNTIIKYYDNYTTGQAEPKMFWGKKPKGVKALSKEIMAFNEAAAEIIKNEKSSFAEAEAIAAAKAAEERKKNYSIEGKDVVKVEIINLKVPAKFGHFRGFDFDVLATLKDGTKISTEGYSQGYISEYSIQYSAENYNGSLASGFVKDDKIKVTVTSKFHPSLSDSKDVTVLYNEDVQFNYNARSWTRSAGESASSYRIEVAQVKHAVNGSDLLKIRIYDANGTTLVSEFKMAADQTLHFYAKGGSGGTDNGKGYNGGDGGNLTIIKDPSVKVFNLDYNINGASGGQGHNASVSGRAGRDGTYREEVRAVKF